MYLPQALTTKEEELDEDEMKLLSIKGTQGADNENDSSGTGSFSLVASQRNE